LIGYDHFEFSIPTRVVFGWGTTVKAGELLSKSISKVLVITDEGVKIAGLLDKVVSALKSRNINVVVFDKVESDPSLDTIETALDLAKTEKVDALVAVGGGSSIDTAKSVAVLFTNGGELRRFEGLHKISKPGITLLAVPTTAGTGSEVTMFAVITDNQNKRKFTVGSRYLFPTIALVDPELTLTLPPVMTAATGMDALTHAVESYTSKISQPASDALALSAISLISKKLRVAVLDGDNVLARNDMMKAQLLAGMAFNNSLLGLCHAIASPLGAHFHLPHGLTNAVMLPYVMEYNVPAGPGKYVSISRALGVKIDGLTDFEAAYAGVSAIRNLVNDIGMPTCLKEVKGVSKMELKMVARDSLKSGMFKLNIRRSSESEVLTLLERAYNGTYLYQGRCK